jgi:hypothetical protein
MRWITLSLRMWCLSSEAESSAGFQPAVSQDFILQTEQTCQTVLINSITMQVKNLRYGPADARRRGTLRLRATLDLGSSETTRQTPKNHAARTELKRFWMQFQEDEAKFENRGNWR